MKYGIKSIKRGSNKMLKGSHKYKSWVIAFRVHDDTYALLKEEADGEGLKVSEYTKKKVEEFASLHNKVI